MASRETTENICGVDMILTEARDGARKSLATGEELLSLTNHLQDMVAQFKWRENTEETPADISCSISPS